MDVLKDFERRREQRVKAKCVDSQPNSTSQDLSTFLEDPLKTISICSPVFFTHFSCNTFDVSSILQYMRHKYKALMNIGSSERGSTVKAWRVLVRDSLLDGQTIPSAFQTKSSSKRPFATTKCHLPVIFWQCNERIAWFNLQICY